MRMLTSLIGRRHDYCCKTHAKQHKSSTYQALSLSVCECVVYVYLAHECGGSGARVSARAVTHPQSVD